MGVKKTRKPRDGVILDEEELMVYPSIGKSRKIKRRNSREG